MKLFLTDYASYNNGTQFEFGHWVDLTDFSDAEEFNDYITTHFNEADEKSPLPCGTAREELMFTDFEDMPRYLYSESLSPDEITNIYEFMDAVNESCLSLEIITAYAEHVGEQIDIDVIVKAEEAYSGTYDSDEQFAEEFAEEVGAIDKNTSWPNTCIDRERAARELMYDYFEASGHYFRYM